MKAALVFAPVCSRCFEVFHGTVSDIGDPEKCPHCGATFHCVVYPWSLPVKTSDLFSKAGELTRVNNRVLYGINKKEEMT